MILLMSGLLSNVYSQVEYEDNYEYEEPEYRIGSNRAPVFYFSK